jgi:hypothetical protein
MPESKAYFMVRVQVTDAALRERFDRWYADEHLPEAAAAFGAERACRFWSRSDPAVHIALYGFPSLAAAQHGTRAEVIAPLIAEFDRSWPSGTSRSRDYLELAGEWTP